MLSSIRTVGPIDRSTFVADLDILAATKRTDIQIPHLLLCQSLPHMLASDSEIACGELARRMDHHEARIVEPEDVGIAMTLSCYVDLTELDVFRAVAGEDCLEISLSRWDARLRESVVCAQVIDPFRLLHLSYFG